MRKLNKYYCYMCPKQIGQDEVHKIEGSKFIVRTINGWRIAIFDVTPSSIGPRKDYVFDVCEECKDKMLDAIGEMKYEH